MDEMSWWKLWMVALAFALLAGVDGQFLGFEGAGWWWLDLGTTVMLWAGIAFGMVRYGRD